MFTSRKLIFCTTYFKLINLIMYTKFFIGSIYTKKNFFKGNFKTTKTFIFILKNNLKKTFKTYSLPEIVQIVKIACRRGLWTFRFHRMLWLVSVFWVFYIHMHKFNFKSFCYSLRLCITNKQKYQKPRWIITVYNWTGN